MHLSLAAAIQNHIQGALHLWPDDGVDAIVQVTEPTGSELQVVAKIGDSDIIAARICLGCFAFARVQPVASPHSLMPQNP